MWLRSWWEVGRLKGHHQVLYIRQSRKAFTCWAIGWRVLGNRGHPRKGDQGGRKQEDLPSDEHRGRSLTPAPPSTHVSRNHPSGSPSRLLAALPLPVHHHGRKKKTGALRCRVSRQEEQGGAGTSGLEGARRPGCATILGPMTSIWRKRTFCFLTGKETPPPKYPIRR